MAKKTYRPKSGVEGLRVSFPTTKGYRDIDSFPYDTDDEEEQAYLDGVGALTDRPAPTKSKGGDQETASGNEKGGNG